MLAATGVSAKSPASVLKPVQQKASDADDADARSPPAKRARSAAGRANSAASAPSPEKGPAADPVAACPLTPELELLASMFEALQTGRNLLKRRNERVTYNSVKHIVENMTKRELRVDHIAQMKALRPESFDWQYIRAPSASNPSQLETQLLLLFDRPGASDPSGAAGGSAAGGGSVGRYSAPSEAADFRARLAKFAAENPVDPVTGAEPALPSEPLPPRPPASGTPSRCASLPGCGLSPAASAGAGGGLRSAASCPPGPSFEAQLAGALGGLAAAGSASPSATRSASGGADASAPGSGGSGASGTSASLTRTRSRLGLPPTALAPSLMPIPEGGTPGPGALSAPAGAGAGAAPKTPTTSRGGAKRLLSLEGSGEGSAPGVVVVLDDRVQDASGVEAAGGQALELSQQGAGGSSGAGGGGGGGAATPKSAGVRPAPPRDTTPTSQLRPAGAGGGDADPRLARLHSMLSPAALQKIQQVEAAAAAQTPEAKRRAEQRKAVGLLPSAHDLVRQVFGPTGPTVKPLTQVAQLMCERCPARAGLSLRDATNALTALARAVPEFLRIEEPRVLADGSARPRSVAIVRSAAVNAVVAKLKALAADADAGAAAIFGGGLAAAPSPTASAGAAAAAAACALPPSPSVAAAGAGLAEPPGSPSGRLRPRMLVLDEEAGPSTAVTGLAAAAVPPPTSARKRPPGLPLAPPSPMMPRGAQTPSRSVLRSAMGAGGGGLLASFTGAAGGPMGPSAPPPSAPQGTPSRAAAPAPAPPSAEAAAAAAAEAAELRQKLCRAGTPSAGVKTAAGGEVRSRAGAGEAADGAQEGRGATLAGSAGEAPGPARTPARAGRTPGRTAVQEAMLGSIRRSSARVSSRSVAKVEHGDADMGEAEDDKPPEPRRLLMDD
ncbi:hypothetical protein HYH03_002761 [Edaphochlamys debaryana]|uniref:CDT1 Geminin-binding domain-containing protein n=1 Tax=Edaphochlamys debaryana TaxID=47281 RepID=A0A836C3U5_9CHLO|nr:hypothetical protein HYH03_002761 [Edaphochlamys debaryana]|eukprot:KAG2499180.1 hypothetical protein HYH03_002761 [Edaphochlamys debaryana]